MEWTVKRDMGASGGGRGGRDVRTLWKGGAGRGCGWEGGGAGKGLRAGKEEWAFEGGEARGEAGGEAGGMGSGKGGTRNNSCTPGRAVLKEKAKVCGGDTRRRVWEHGEGWE